MEFDEFVEINLKEWNEYFESVFCLISEGIWKLGTGILLYPNIALFVETDDHYIFELFGATKNFNGLEKKIHRESSTLKYLYQFDSGQEGPTFEMRGRCNGFSNLIISRDADYEALKKRFGFSERWKTKLNFRGGRGATLSFSETFKSIFINRCLLVNRYNEIYRVKHILHMRIVSKDHSKEEYLADFRELLNKPWITTDDLFGVSFLRDYRDESSILAGQFANIFLLPGLPETTIGKFLEKNPTYILRAFSCKNFLYEKELEWIEGNPDPNEKTIKPDLMLEKENGFYDICDLKTAALSKQRITKGGHRRRRFIDYVYEGVSQLANYENYFNFEKNRAYAVSKHNIKVDHPNLFLIVGNYENAPKNEIEEASRMLRLNYLIIDYDTLNSMFLNSFS